VTSSCTPLRRLLLACATLAGALAPLAARANGWTSPVLVSNDVLEDFAGQDVTYDPQGRAFVQYVTSARSRRFVVRPRFGTFGPPQAFPGDDAFTEARFAFLASGDAVVAWLGASGHVAYRHGDGTWEPAQNLGFSSSFDLAVADDGSALLVWTSTTGIKTPTNAVVFAARSPGPTGKFSTPTNIVNPAVSSTGPIFAVLDPNGGAGVIWEQDGSLRGAQRLAGQSLFGTPMPIDTAGGLFAAHNAAGRMVAVWPGAGATPAAWRGVVREPGGGFQTKINITGQPAAPNAEGAVAIDADGRAVVVLQIVDTTDPCLSASHLLTSVVPAGGETFGPIEELAAGAVTPSVAALAGTTATAWSYFPPDDAGYCTATHANAQSEIEAAVGSIPTQVFTRGVDVARPKIALDPMGDAMVVWEQEDASLAPRQGVVAAVLEGGVLTTTSTTTTSSTTTPGAPGGPGATTTTTLLEISPLAALIQAATAVDLGPRERAMLAALTHAASDQRQAVQASLRRRRRKARAALGRAIKDVVRFEKLLRSRRSAVVPADIRDHLLVLADRVLVDFRARRAAV
jgi:hypothetical protein